MDREMTEAFRDQREAFSRLEGKVEGKIDELRADMHKHFLDDARTFAKLEDKASSAHKRIDEHLRDHRSDVAGRRGIWVGLFLTVAATVLTWLFSFFGRRSS
jgi:hypothetical protein